MKAIEKALLDHTIPYQLIAEDEFFSKPLVKEVATLLKYAEDPENSFLRNKLEHLKPSPDGLNHALSEIKQRDKLKDKIQYAYDTLINDSQNREEEVYRKLLDLAEYYNNRINKFIRYLTLGSSPDAYDHKTEKVTVMTLHASKGLEFKCVFIAGCEEGLIPYTLFKNQETDREEEKRLLYVGMTRAKSYLYLTHATKRFIMGRERTMQRSPFLNRIEKELTEVDKNTYKKKKQDDSQLKLF
jgi:superfamily I DNA/RNA helicase